MKAKKVKIKTRPGITDELIHNYLTHFGLIENYYIWGTPKSNIGIIYFLGYKNDITTFLAYIDEEGFVECDEQKFFAIYREHNSDLPQMVLARLKQELEIAGSNPAKLHNTWDSISENIHSLTKCWTELSVEHFSPELIELIVREMNKPKETSFSNYAKMILENLKYKF